MNSFLRFLDVLLREIPETGPPGAQSTGRKGSKTADIDKVREPIYALWPQKCDHG